MIVKMPILNLNDVGYTEQFLKVKEEYYEFIEAFATYRCKHDSKSLLSEMSEALDLLQSLIGYITKSYCKKDIEQAFIRHYNKLESRDRAIIGSINININGGNEI